LAGTRNTVGLARRFWEIGYATEGVKVVKRMTRRYLPELSLISVIHPDNINQQTWQRQWVRTLNEGIISEMIPGIFTGIATYNSAKTHLRKLCLR
jgi:hypothetical protein